MKVRFYCDVPNCGVRIGTPGGTALFASTNPGQSGGHISYTRVAFDVDMPPNLVLPAFDAQAPATQAQVVDDGEAA